MNTSAQIVAPVGIALIGCGAIGELVARRVYAAGQPGYRLVAAIDPRPERAQAVADATGATAYASAAEAAAAGAPIDAADIRVPHAAHADAATGAVARNWHVLAEKPLATTLADADRIIRAAAQSHKTVAVAENYPHLLSVQATAGLLRAGQVGEVSALRTTRAYTLGGVWMRDGWRRGGPSAGLLLDQATHHMSLLRQLGGEITAVSTVPSRSATSRETAAETLAVTVLFASGLAGQSLYSWVTHPVDGDCEGMVFGSKGRIEIRVAYDGERGGAWLWESGGGTSESISPPENYYDSHGRIIEDWVEAIRTGKPPRVGLAEARADLAAVVAAQRSLRAAGLFVQVPPPIAAANRHPGGQVGPTGEGSMA